MELRKMLTVVWLTALAATVVPFAKNARAQVPVDEQSDRLDDHAASAPVRQGPRRLKPGECGVGRHVPDLSFTDIDGKRYRLSDFRDRQAVVIAMTGTGCPLCLKYAPTLARIEAEYTARDVAFIFVNPNESEKSDALRAAIRTHGFQGPYVQDAQMELPRSVEADTTTEVFVLDKARTLVYRGAVDDQYGFGYSLDKPRFRYLADALDAVLAGDRVDVRATSSPGCELFYGDASPPDTPATITYHNRISRIIQANCIECHRDGGIAPIALESYEQVKDYAGMIRSVVDRRIMPPWFAAPQPDRVEDGSAISHWANERALAAAEKADLFAWIESGAPQGDPQDAPLARSFPDGWLIGKPDAVFEFGHPVQVKATGTMPYQYVTVETDLPEDTWVQAIEVRPGNINVVHHVIVALRGVDNEVDERDGYWGAYVPGNSTLVYPDGYARLLPKGAKLRFQMHYTPNGTATEDSTRIGLVFAKEPPRHEVKVAGIANARIRIPPGAGNHQEVASLRLPFDVQILGFLPHMHLRGKAARYEALTADGTEVLLDIPRYDFNWQLLYQLAEPRALRQGDTIRFTCWFDNSENNPANPDPSKTVRWGPQTEDEMHLGYVEYIIPGATPGEGVTGTSRSGGSAESRSHVRGGLFHRLDVNGDGNVTRDEVRQVLPGNTDAAGPIFDRLDQDRDGKIDEAEFSKLEQPAR